MPSHIGKQALVVGAGMGGLTAARVLADYFEQVLILERDTLPMQVEHRAGIPQGRHVHVLLSGGLRALCALFPGFADTLMRTGAVSLQTGRDIRIERPGYDPYPQRDLGVITYAQSRAQLEHNVRQHVLRHANVALRQACRVQACTVSEECGRVTGLTYVPEGGGLETLAADLVIDASGRGALTLAVLEALGQALPVVSTVGVDLAYATAVFAQPSPAPSDWKAVLTMARPPESSRAGLLMPVEGERWILSVGGRKNDEPPGDPAGFMSFVQQLRTPTIYNAVQHAERLGAIANFRFPESIYRHYTQLESFPRGLLPLGDAICRFNPIYGQGMSVAIQEAQALGQLLAERASSPEPFAGLSQAFFAAADTIIETPWASSVIPDFVYPDTRGERPADLDKKLQAGNALTELAARDAAVHKLTLEVANLVQPRSVLQTPALRQRVQEIMQEMAAVQ